MAEIPAETIERNKKIGKGCAWFGGGFFALMVVVAMFADDPAPTPDGSAQAAPSDDAALQSNVRDWYGRVLATAQPCDNAMATLGTHMTAISEGNGDFYEGYTAASAAERVCSAAWLAFDDIPEVDDLPDEVGDRVDETIQTCETAYFSKKEAAATAGEIFDGDMRPSKVSELGENVEAGNAGMMSCLAGAMAVASAVGIDLESLDSPPEN